MRAVLTLTTLTVLGGLVAYAVYFDYKRRNDVDFRKKLRRSSPLATTALINTHNPSGKDKKRVDKTVAQTKSKETEASSSVVSADELRAALETVKSEEPPQSAEAREQYFMSQVGLGEQLAVQGVSELLHPLKGSDLYINQGLRSTSLQLYPSTELCGSIHPLSSSL
jgi:import receptor subunit TOM20